jgi:hypothetical protein
MVPHRNEATLAEGVDVEINAVRVVGMKRAPALQQQSRCADTET